MGLIVSIGCDHTGVMFKSVIMEKLRDFVFIDRGTFSTYGVDYPDIAKLVTDDIEHKLADFGVLICGTGIGMSIAANRSVYSRAALCYDTETAWLARQHNDANIICLGARKTSAQDAVSMCAEFFSTGFAGGRHSVRIEKLGLR